MIPFAPPRIDQKIIDEVTAVLKSGWITTGPRTKLFEKKITEYTQTKTTVCVSSWTMGMTVLLDWWGIQEGDEVIVPAYTYCASGNVVLQSGAKLVLVDVLRDSCLIDPEAVRKAITTKTKVIMPVDIGGMPCDYSALQIIIKEKEHLFSPNNEKQRKLGRIALITDAAHSFGAKFKGKPIGSVADMTVFSFHAVKNLTTAEGGAISFNLPNSFEHDEIYKHFCVKILHGQSKDALAKTQKGAWRYDVEFPGFKCNMTDLQAAIGLIEIDRYPENLARRKQIFQMYDVAFEKHDNIISPKYYSESRTTSYHLYMIRLKGFTENQRDACITNIAENEVGVNVHFQPLPLLTAYKERGYAISDFPNAQEFYANEISLPVYYDLTDEQVDTVIKVVKEAVEKIKAHG
jgi:dTDP-4-amino-4,6-dideoxygalactose transaminase